MDFKYIEELDNKTFRIFKLEPGQKTDDLRGSLQTHSLNSPPQYEALSYVWGPPDRNESMNCDGQEFKITHSLDVALRRLRLFDKSRFLWIDQICINQSSNKERSTQVGLMKSIYSQASLVIAWLGPVDRDEANSAKEIITALGRLEEFSLEHEQFPKDEKLLEYNLPARSSPAWSGLNSILTATYFSRVWIIQEVAVASKFELLWGDIAISRDDLRNSIFKAILIGMRAGDISSKDCPKLDWSPVALSLLFDKTDKEPDLFQLVCQAASSHATDERDKIFALIGIAGEHTYGMLPDYEKPAVEVFTDFVRNVVATTGSLEILDYSDVKDPNLPGCLPLWAPRWHAGDKRRGFLGYGFEASRDTKALPRTLSNLKVLELKGLQADTVKDVHHRVRVVHENILAAFEMVKDNIQVFEHRYGPDLLEPILLTLMADREVIPVHGMHDYNRPTDRTFVNNFIASTVLLLEDFCTFPDYSETFQREVFGLLRSAIRASPSATEGEPVLERLDGFKECCRQTLETLFPEDPEIVSSDMEMIGILSCDLIKGWTAFGQSCSISEDLNFFVTEKGFMGVGPRCMEPEDRVCILFGGSTPYIIRPTSRSEDSFLYLGPAYVHGIMDGEVINAWEGQGLEDNEFQETEFKLL